MVRRAAFFRIVFGRNELLPEGHTTMWRFLKDLILGEPAASLGIVAVGFGAAVAALVGLGDPVPLWLAVAAPVSSAVAAGYTRQMVDSIHPSPFSH